MCVMSLDKMLAVCHFPSDSSLFKVSVSAASAEDVGPDAEQLQQTASAVTKPFQFLVPTKI